MSSKQIGQLSGASKKLKVPSGRQGMLNVDLVRSVSQNLVRLFNQESSFENIIFSLEGLKLYQHEMICLVLCVWVYLSQHCSALTEDLV